MSIFLEKLASFPSTLLSYFDAGGFVMPPLALATLVLWYCLGLRFSTLSRGNPRSARVLIERYQRGYNRPPRGVIDTAVVWGLNLSRQNKAAQVRSVLDDAFGAFEPELKQGRTLIKSIVSTAPLAGLLGTVIGMIETFESLADMALFSQSGGIAGGISQALFTTQMGLAVAVPGIVLGRLLDRKEQRFREELESIKQLLCQDVAETPAAREGAAENGAV